MPLALHIPGFPQISDNKLQDFSKHFQYLFVLCVLVIIWFGSFLTKSFFEYSSTKYPHWFKKLLSTDSAKPFPEPMLMLSRCICKRIINQTDNISVMFRNLSKYKMQGFFPDFLLSYWVTIGYIMTLKVGQYQTKSIGSLFQSQSTLIYNLNAVLIKTMCGGTDKTVLRTTTPLCSRYLWP